MGATQRPARLMVAPSRRKRKSQLCLDPSDIEGFEIKMVWIFGSEPTAPPTAHCLPVLAQKRPELWRRETGREVAHSKVNRQRWASCVEGRRRSRIDVNLEAERSETRDDEDPWPTNPLGGKGPPRLVVQAHKHICQSRRNTPSSRYAASVSVGDFFRRQYPARA